MILDLRFYNMQPNVVKLSVWVWGGLLTSKGGIGCVLLRNADDESLT